MAAIEGLPPSAEVQSPNLAALFNEQRRVRKEMAQQLTSVVDEVMRRVPPEVRQNRKIFPFSANSLGEWLKQVGLSDHGLGWSFYAPNCLQGFPTTGLAKDAMEALKAAWAGLVDVEIQTPEDPESKRVGLFRVVCRLPSAKASEEQKP